MSRRPWTRNGKARRKMWLVLLPSQHSNRLAIATRPECQLSSSRFTEEIMSEVWLVVLISHVYFFTSTYFCSVPRNLHTRCPSCIGPHSAGCILAARLRFFTDTKHNPWLSWDINSELPNTISVNRIINIVKRSREIMQYSPSFQASMGTQSCCRSHCYYYDITGPQSHQIPVVIILPVTWATVVYLWWLLCNFSCHSYVISMRPDHVYCCLLLVKFGNTFGGTKFG